MSVQMVQQRIRTSNYSDILSIDRVRNKGTLALEFANDDSLLGYTDTNWLTDLFLASHSNNVIFKELRLLVGISLSFLVAYQMARFRCVYTSKTASSRVIQARVHPTL